MTTVMHWLAVWTAKTVSNLKRRVCRYPLLSPRRMDGLADPQALKMTRFQRVEKSSGKVWAVFTDTLVLMKGKPKCRRPLILSIPYIGVLCLAHVAGEVMGVVRGPGQSPHFVD